MSGTVAEVAGRVPGSCHAIHCNKDRCRVDLKGAPETRLLVDMDCDGLEIPRQQKRCDYLFVGERGHTTWIAPIELKSGGLKAVEVLEQLEGGTGSAHNLLPEGISFQFVPILAHGKSIHRNDLKVLRSRKIQLRGQRRVTVLIKCGDPLIKALHS